MKILLKETILGLEMATKLTLKETVALQNKQRKAFVRKDIISRITITRVAPVLATIFVVWYLLRWSASDKLTPQREYFR